MTQTPPLRTLSKARHDIKQPLNVINLTCANLRARLGTMLKDEDGQYLEDKLQRIEQQVLRATGMLDGLR